MKIQLTEEQLDRLIEKTINEQSSESGALTGVQAYSLPYCSSLKDEELIGAVVHGVAKPEGYLSTISQSSTSRTGRSAKLYLVKKNKNLCKLK